MNKELRDMLEQISDKKERAKQLLAENKIEEAKVLRNEILSLQNKFDIAKDLYEQEKEGIENKKTFTSENAESDFDVFARAVRSGFKNATGLKESTDANGGYIVPKDILTRINELRESKDALQNLITVEPVNTLSGSRVFKARAQQTGFAEVSEDGTIAEKDAPTFSQLAYSVKKYAGFFKVTNELLADSDQAVVDTLTRWIGDESRVTRNKLILAALGTKAKTAIADMDDIKDTVNVTLDPSFKQTAVVLTNQTGFNWLDKLKDNDGDYLLERSISSPTGKMLLGMNVIVVSNKDLPNDTTSGTKAPMIIGDLKEAVVMFDRQSLSIASSTQAGNAFTTDVTLWRAIEREEVKIRDEEAFVYGQVTIA